jgi:hypothetical protein
MKPMPTRTHPYLQLGSNPTVRPWSKKTKNKMMTGVQNSSPCCAEDACKAYRKVKLKKKGKQTILLRLQCQPTTFVVADVENEHHDPSQ